MIFFLSLFLFSPLNAQNLFEEIQNSIEGEIFILRKKIEEPILEHPIYDLHFRKFDYKINKKELELSLESETYKNKFLHYNWTLSIPINEQSYLHIKEAESLWNQKKQKEAIFIYKALIYSTNKEINANAQKILHKITNYSNMKNNYNKIDPYFLYFLEKNQIKIFSDTFGFHLSFLEYWNLVFTQNNEWFYFIKNSEDKKIFLLTNQNYDLYFYITRNNIHRKKIENFIKEIDLEFSWNENTKKHYSFQRETINSNLYLVKFYHQNRNVSYYELIFFNISCILYLRIYNKKEESKNKIFELINSFVFT